MVAVFKGEHLPFKLQPFINSQLVLIFAETHPLMDGKNDAEKSSDDFMLPGFRFHPTDEELVEFYLKRKLQQRPLPIELIKQVDIYKFDPWDLPTPPPPPPAPPKRILDKNLPPTDSWAICRIFKKTNSTAQRALSHSWAVSLSETASPDANFTYTYSTHPTQFNSSENISSTTENEFQPVNFADLNIPSYKTISGKPAIFPSANGDYFPGNLIFSSSEEVSGTSNKTTVDLTSMLFNLSPALAGEACKTSESIDFEGPQQQFNGYSVNSSQVMQPSINPEDEQEGFRKNQSITNTHNQWGNLRSMGFPFSLPSATQDSWKPNLPWDSPPCPSEISSTNYSTNKCYT
ncbi:protein FEZ [Sesamum alatum]|uniref:Protein FEZ n=1 Tax=Sesamum alatum TaxID=300844 RepID=A0AAE1XT96_9LAMI|nr:protein FEZ [Sesamum alatum]